MTSESLFPAKPFDDSVIQPQYFRKGEKDNCFPKYVAWAMSSLKFSKLADFLSHSRYFFACLNTSHRQGNNLCSKKLSFAGCRA